MNNVFWGGLMLHRQKTGLPKISGVFPIVRKYKEVIFLFKDYFLN